MSQTKAELIQTVKQGTVSLGDADSSHSIKLKAPATVAADRTWTMPSVDPTANQVLRGNSSTPTTLEWGTISSTPEGTAILSTGESGSTKFLREDGDGTCSWQVPAGGVGSDAQYNTKGGDAAGNALDADTLGNTLFGENAGTAINSGDYNNCFGYESGKALTSGNYNIAVGFESLKTATTGGGNIAIGHKAMNGGDITGANNVAIGYESGKSFAGNINGNVAMGYRALYTQSGDKYNTAIGYEAGRDIGDAHDVVAVGHKAFQQLTTGAYNTAVGWQAGYSCTTGARNVAIGREAMALNVSGNDNTCVGIEAGRAITAGENTCIGRYAGRTNTTGDKNVYIGAHCADAGINGQYNVAIGTYAFSTSNGDDKGSNCTMVGYGAGFACYGGGNTLIGQQAAGNSLTSGTNNVCIGKEAAYSQLAADGSNQLYIARGNVAAGSNSCWVYGDGDGNVIRAGNGTAWSQTSDERIKKDIVDNNVGLSIINQVKVRNFKYRTEAEIDRTAFGGSADDPKWTAEEAAKHEDAVEGEYMRGYGIDIPGTQIGVIAQELESVLPGGVKTDSNGKKQTDTSELFWHMLNAIKELSTKVTALEAA